MTVSLLDPRGRPRVVITGSGSLSCLGQDNAALLDALKQDRSGLRAMDSLARYGLRCQVGGPVDLSGLPEPPRKLRRFLAAPARYAWHPVQEAIAHAGLPPAIVQGDACALVFGGGAALSEHEEALAQYREKGSQRLSPFLVPRGMSASLSASLAHALGIRGRSMTISAACTSATLAIGHAMELIQLEQAQVVLCGGAEELHPSTVMWFDAMDALAHTAGIEPASASRPYAQDRSGFVLAAGAGALVVESLEHALQRGATIRAELTGYGVATDPSSMVGPGHEGIARALSQALGQDGRAPDYINTHACATPAGDREEWLAIANVFAARQQPVPPLSSIKGLSGHAPAAAGALDAIACLLMLEHGFVAAGRAPEHLDPVFARMPLVLRTRPANLDGILSSNFGFGGNCAALMFRRYAEARP